jgi:hypothetical protein
MRRNGHSKADEGYTKPIRHLVPRAGWRRLSFGGVLEQFQEK